MTQPNLPAPGAEMIAQSSPVSRPSPPGGLRPALTPAAGSTGLHRSGAGQKEDQQIKIRLTEVSTVRGDCQMTVRTSVVVIEKEVQTAASASRRSVFGFRL